MVSQQLARSVSHEKIASDGGGKLIEKKRQSRIKKYPTVRDVLRPVGARVGPEKKLRARSLGRLSVCVEGFERAGS